MCVHLLYTMAEQFEEIKFRKKFILNKRNESYSVNLPKSDSYKVDSELEYDFVAKKVRSVNKNDKEIKKGSSG
jgi:hypothetical protein